MKFPFPIIPLQPIRPISASDIIAFQKFVRDRTIAAMEVPEELYLSVASLLSGETTVHFDMANAVVARHPWDVEQVEDGKGLFGCSWFVTNVMSGASMRVGPVRSTGKNFYDQAVALADQRNEKFAESTK